MQNMEDAPGEAMDSHAMRRGAVLRGSLKVVIAYLVFGVAWILSSDHILSSLVPAADLPFWQSIKGVLFIVITSLLLFLLVRRQLGRWVRALRASRESELRFRGMFQHASVALIEFDDQELRHLLQEWLQDDETELFSLLQQQPERIGQALSRLRVVSINPEVRRLFAVQNRTDLSHVLSRIFADAPMAFMASFFTALAQRSSRFSNELTVFGRDGRSRQLQFSATFPAPDSSQLSLLSLTDVSDTRYAETRHRVLQGLSQEVNACADLDSALRLTLQRICEVGQWQLGQIWAAGRDGDVLTVSDIHYLTDERLAPFHQLSREQAFMRGRGLPGRVWLLQQPVWIRDVTLDSNFPRAPMAERLQLRNGVAFPLLQDGRLLYVLEFFGYENRREDRGLLELIAAAMVQVLWVLASKQQAQRLAQTERHFTQAMAIAGFGFWNWDIASGHVEWAGKVERMFGLADGGFDGRINSYLALLPDGDRQHVEATIAAALQGSNEHFLVQHRIKLGDGQMRWLEGRGMVLRDAAHHPTAMSGIVTDITEQQLDARLLPALAALLARPNSDERVSALLHCLGDSLGADDVILLPASNRGASPAALHWQAGAYLPDSPVLGLSELLARVRQTPMLHESQLTRCGLQDVWLVQRESRELLSVWLDAADVEAGVLLVLFRRQLLAADRVLALLQLLAPHLRAALPRSAVRQ